MIIDCISDLHGWRPGMKGGDLLILAGDMTAWDSPRSWNSFLNWVDYQDYRKKIMIAGNHDNFCRNWATSDDSVCDALAGRPSVSYLCDSGIEFEGLKIWGSPWTQIFEGMNERCAAFTLDTEEELEEKWALIPSDTDILITHSPPMGLLDHISFTQEWVGSVSLRNAILSQERFTNLKLHVFGHIHECGGKVLKMPTLTLVNASHVNEECHPTNAATRITL